MGIKNFLAKRVEKAGDRIAKCSALSVQQVEDIERDRSEYYSALQKFNPNDPSALELTEKLIGLSSVEIFNAYLPQLADIYVPLQKDAEYERPFNPDYNIRYFNITKWVTDKDENSLEKLVNVYAVLSDEECNIALVFNRKYDKTEVYLAVVNTKNADSNTDVNRYRKQLADAIKGNFPGSELKTDKNEGVGIIPCLKNSRRYSVASASNVPAEKSEKFISQTIEKLLDGIVPENPSQEYTLILLATPIQDVAERKLRLSELYSGLAPYASWQTNFTYVQSKMTGSSANFGVNAGVSAGVQNGTNQSIANSNGVTDSTSNAETNTEGQTVTDTEGTTNTESEGETNTSTETDSVNDSETNTYSNSNTHTETEGDTDTHTDGTSESQNDSDSKSKGFAFLLNVTRNKTSGESHGSNTSDAHSKLKQFSDAVTNTASKAMSHGTGHSTAESIAKTVTNSVAKNISRSVANSTSRALTSTVGRALSRTVTNTVGVSRALSLGGNFGVNFARSSNISATIGNNEGITQTFTNYNIKHALELLEEQMKRYEQSTALGLWDFAAYVLSEDLSIANNVAHSYIALTQGEKSFMSNASINLWRGDMGEESEEAKEICDYLRELRHPVFGINPVLVNEYKDYFVYPVTVTAATSLSGKELAYSLNFPRKSVEGLPVIECAEFGRNIVTYDEEKSLNTIRLGSVFHMHHEENTVVELDLNSLASHTFITGSTGSGKSNTVYQILNEASRKKVNFLVIEPAKGEYKHIYGNKKDVSVYGTNPAVSDLLRINPFSFEKGIHILEHLDGLIEIFNVCWPMYAAMPAVLKSAIEKSYEDCGWNLRESYNPYGDDLYPTFADVTRNIKTIIDSSEYDNENKGAYKGSLITRLQSLTNGINGMIFTSDEISAEELFDKNVICDLSRVRSNETKSLMMGILVLKLQEYRMISGRMNADLKHITVLEEAHNLLKKTSTEQPVEGGNLLGKSVEMISNAIAEMRTYGEGFIIADQSPGLLDMSAIRNTNTKIIMRLPDENDRILVGKSACLNDNQITELARLPRGVAAVYQNEWIQPVLCIVDAVSQNDNPYSYVAETKNEKSDNTADRVEIAEMLCNSVKLESEQELSDVRVKLDNMDIPASVQVLICKLLNKPSPQPNMEQIGEISKYLFPKAYEATKEVCDDTSDKREWTRRIEEELKQNIGREIDDKTRIYLVHGLILAYVYIQCNDIKALQDWTERGGIK
ncbi:MAG: DUF87 domain-containing protein [Oscillospiraceae bacterium]|nr:DUF87 domain-containing protein [Oscillospiraceae bacterium]